MTHPIPVAASSSLHARSAALVAPLWRIVLAAVILGLTACAAPVVQEQRGAPRTDFDSTEADRRAAPRLELAGGYFARGQYNTALDEIKQVLAVKPNMREAINMRGLIYAAMGEPQLADENFRRALVLYPQDPDTLHNYGWFLCQQQRWAAAQAQFDLALAQSSYRAPARSWLAKGVCEAKAGRQFEAEQSLQKAFEYDPASPVVAYNLADVLYRGKQDERARFYIRRVNAQTEQSNAQSLWLALKIERRMGNAQGVAELGQQLRRRYPQSPELQALDGGRFDE
ncbi:type IV pilus assembly protein PilF [Paucibacter oligotrophus]|uniref:Type IV pilus assembly protein PilF n=1 Tax=Roseateles oligotrophus TaxID=1769250 RepID=A0A840L685_9BURK|nr:type IV pilus biogenesis/stability protein PilW [Roseateles oligotrophus]MBB4842115.1 type IV pilus assembly protein PilF [Roseateles oligotrophus]